MRPRGAADAGRWRAGALVPAMAVVVAAAVTCAAVLSGAAVARPDSAQPPVSGGDCAAPGTGPAVRVVVDGADLLLRDATGAAVARWPLRDADGRPGQPLAVCWLAPRHSFTVVVPGWLELWEISTDPAAPPIFDGLVHDYRMGEAIARPGHLGVRRIRLARPWVGSWADGRVPWLLGIEAGSDAEAVVLHLDVRRAVGRLPLAADGGWPAIEGRRFPWGPGPVTP